MNKIKQKTIIAFLTMILNISFAFNISAQSYDSTYFPIGVWSIKGDFRPVEDYLYVEENGKFVMPEKAPAYHEQLFSELESYGFNAAFMSLDPIGPTIHSIVEKALQHNIKIVSSMQNLSYIISQSNDDPPSGDDIRQAILNDSIEFLSQSPGILGYYLYDEPLPGWIDFDILKQAKDSLLRLSGGNHPVLSAWNDVQHMEYIDGYLHQDVLLADTYPFSDSTSKGSLIDYMPAYFSSYGDPDDPSTIGPATPGFSEYIEMIRKQQCNNPDRPFWIVFQSFGDVVRYEDESWAFWRQVYPKEIRLQVWISVMQGAKGLWYFLYESEYPGLMGLLDLSGQPTCRLQEVADINSEISSISNILLKLDVVEDAQVTVDKGEVKMHVDKSKDTDNKYVIVTNTDYYNSQDIVVTVSKSEIGYKISGITEEKTNTSIPFTETDDEIQFTASLDRADGSLYHYKKKNSDGNKNSFKNDNIVIYPNPVLNKFIIRNNGREIKSVSIFNELGQKVLDKHTGDSTVNVGDLKNGYYTVKVRIDNKLLTEKILILRP